MINTHKRTSKTERLFDNFDSSRPLGKVELWNCGLWIVDSIRVRSKKGQEKKSLGDGRTSLCHAMINPLINLLFGNQSVQSPEPNPWDINAKCQGRTPHYPGDHCDPGDELPGLVIFKSQTQILHVLGLFGEGPVPFCFCFFSQQSEAYCVSVDRMSANHFSPGLVRRQTSDVSNPLRSFGPLRLRL